MSIPNLKNKIFILVFLGILVFPWIVGGILRLVSPETFDQLSKVETENRELQNFTLEELMDSGESLMGFVDDRIPFRYVLISWYKGLNDAIEGTYQTAASAIGGSLYKDPKSDFEHETVEATVEPEGSNEEEAEVAYVGQLQPTDTGFYPIRTYQDVIIARDGWLFLYGENEFECYQGTNILEEKEMASFASKVNALQSICNAHGKELYFYIAPNKSQVFSQFMPTVEIVNPYKREQQLHSYISEHCSTPFLYPLTEALTAASTNQTYYKYDSHWNHLGALYGTNALYAAMGIEQTEPTSWITGIGDADKYELYTYMGIPDNMVAHDDVEFIMDYRPEVTVNGLNLDAMINRTTSDGGNNKRLCLIGDSFRVNMMPYLAKDFTACTFCHRDYMNEIQGDIANADIIVIEAVERYDYEAFKTAQKIINMYSN